jgi:hypothetical protein
VVHDSDFGIRARQLIGDLRRRIDAPVVDDDDFEVRCQGARGPPGGDDEARNRPAVGVGGKKDSEPWLPGGRLRQL